MKGYSHFLLFFVFLLSCKSDSDKFDDIIKSKIPLKTNEKLAYFENVKIDSISLREIDNFISNNAYQMLIHFNREQNKIGSQIKNMDTAKTVDGIRKFEKEFNSKMRKVSDSFQYYSKIVDATIESKKSEKKVVRIVEYKYTISNEETKKKTDLETTIYIDGNKVFMHPEAFFRYKIKEIVTKK